MLNLAMLAAMTRWHEFERHVRGSRANGVTDDETIEIILQVRVFCRPLAAEAMRIVDRVMNEPTGAAGTKMQKTAPGPRAWHGRFYADCRSGPPGLPH
jgi:hypothetical protein